MEDRPKRVVNKPVRYKTTSSDEGPPQKRTAHPPSTIPEGGIEEDIEDIRAILDKDKETDINSINNSMHTQYMPPHIHTHIPTHTNITTYTAPAGATHEQHIQTNHSYVPESEASYYASNKYFELQDTARSWTRMQRENVQLQPEQVSYGQHGVAMMPDQIIKKMDSQYREVNDRLDRMETQMKKINTFLDNIYKCVQNTNQCASVPCRPEMFPIASIAQLRAFQDIPKELYSNAVNYFHYIGGFNFKEAVNLCFKDSIQDSLTPLLTWFGGKENQEALYNTRLVKAIYDGICRNRHFERPLRSEFQTQMQAALRTAKERYRHRRRGTTAGGPRIQRDLWGDDREEEQEEESENT